MPKGSMHESGGLRLAPSLKAILRASGFLKESTHND